MTQLAEEPIWRAAGPWYIRRKRPMAATMFFRHGLIGLDANGRAARIAAAAPGLHALGVSEFTYDNTQGAAGAKDLDILAGLFGKANSGGGDAITNALPPGTPIFAADDDTYALTDNGGTRAVAGAFEFVDEKGIVWAWVGIPFGTRPLVVLSKTVLHGDLTAAATTQEINVGDALPYPARVLGVSVGEGTFTALGGGGTGSATVQVGTTTDPDALRTALNVFTGQTGFPKGATAGVLGYSGAPLAAGTQLSLTFTSDTTVGAYDTGAITTRVILAPGV